MPKFFFVLGSADAEMAAIEAALKEGKIPYAYGTSGGTRVRPGQRADGTSAPIPDGAEVVAVEVAGPWGSPQVDHHEGHPLASAPPSEYWEASSIGQVFRLLNIIPTPSDLATAAADHCLAAAFAGQCPGVDLTPGSWQYQHIVYERRGVFAPGMSLEEFDGYLQRAAATLRAAPAELELDPNGNVRSLLHLPCDGPAASGTGEIYPSDAMFLPLVASMVGLGYVAPIIRADGRRALRMGGCGIGTAAGPEPITRFKAFALSKGAIDGAAPDNIYAVPARGFAGAVLAP